MPAVNEPPEMGHPSALAAGRSYRPGEWFGVFGEHLVVVLPPSEKARVPALWDLVDEGAGFDEVLDALISSGLRNLPGFVLVSQQEGGTLVVLRGAGSVQAATGDETLTLEGSAATTWVERSLTDVRGLRIEVAPADDLDDLAIRTGLVRIARTDWPAAVGLGGVGEAQATSEASAPAPNAPGAESPLDDGPATTPQAPPVPVPVAATAAPTQLPPIEFPPVETPPEVPAAPNWGHPPDHGRSHPEVQTLPPAFPVASPVARLTFSSGEVVVVDRPVLVGRAPEERRFSTTERPMLVAVPSPQHEISSTHLEIRPGSGADHGSAVATDLGSTNGTILVQPGLAPESLKPGVAVQLLPGAVIDLGDGVTIQVGHA